MDADQKDDTMEEQGDGLSSELQYFSERDASVKLINSICGTGTSLEIKISDADKGCKEELDKILLKYLEQPLLISPYVPELVSPLNDVLITAIEGKAPDFVSDTY